MNKFVALVGLVALVVSCALAGDVENVLDDMSSMEMTGDEEASMAANGGEAVPAGMSKDDFYFRDFCVSAEDEIKSFVKARLNGAASNIFSLVLTSGTDMGAEILKAQHDAVEQGTKVIKEAAEQSLKPQAPSDVDANVEKTLDSLASNPSIYESMTSSAKNVAYSIIDTARSAFFQRLTAVKEVLSTPNLKRKVEDACMTIASELIPQINKKLTQAKVQLKKELADQPELFSMLKGKTINNVGCSYSARVWKASKFCDVVKVAAPALFSLVGLKDENEIDMDDD